MAIESIGYALSSEEHPPATLVRQAVRAEECGFDFAMISDHYHPWTTRQGHSAFVWTMLGAIAQATSRLEVGTGVTCPILRQHPAIVAQAAATVATLLEDRFFLGVGSGENLNEHVLGDRWPPAPERLERLEEAIDIIRRLWEGDSVTFEGAYYVVDEAQIFSCPEVPPPIYMAAGGPVAVSLAADIADGLIGLAPDRDLLETFRLGGDDDRPCYGQITLCHAPSDAEARRVVREWWPNAGLGGQLSTEVKTPVLFEAACAPLSEEQVCENTPIGPDPAPYLDAIRAFAEAGYQHVYLHQIGPDQEAFFQFFERELRDRI